MSKNNINEHPEKRCQRPASRPQLSMKLVQPQLHFLSAPMTRVSLDIFDDPSFPACADSIDGRQLGTKVHGSATIICRCSRQPRLRQVFKDGPNQGRYFHSCATKTCDFFAWADFAPHDEASMKIEWKRFTEEQGWSMVSDGFSPDHILQGGVGDCWWLSALAVVTERRDLIENIVLDKPKLPQDGSARFRLFIDGNWQVIKVDTQLPCRGSEHRKRKVTTSSDGPFMFSRAKHCQLWVPLLEKAYAKAHGSLYPFLHQN